MQAHVMAAAYALISILSATGGVLALWPWFGWWSLASVWPVGGLSCLLSAVMVTLLRSRHVGDIDHLTDEMVADLRGVLAIARPASGENDQATDDAQRYGTAG